MHTRTDKLSKNKRAKVFAHQYRQCIRRELNVNRCLARNRELFRMAQGRQRWEPRYADICDGNGNVVASKYMGHFVVNK